MLSKSVLTTFLRTLLFLPVANMFFLRGMRSLPLGIASSSLRQLNPVFNHVLIRSTSSKVFSSNNANIQTVLICGPSGVGKGTLITRLLTDYADICSLSVSHTSRAPRPGEINGTHYHFITKESFLNEIENGTYQFLETAHVHGNLYGTREDAVSKIHTEGKLCVLDLDVKGVKQLKQKNYPMKTVFIAPPSMQALENRLRNRATESEAQITLRVNNSKEEVEYGLKPGNFDRIIVNDDLEQAYKNLIEQMRNWFPSYIR